MVYFISEMMRSCVYEKLLSLRKEQWQGNGASYQDQQHTSRSFKTLLQNLLPISRAKQLLRDSFGVQNTFPSLSTIGWREIIVSDRCDNGPASTETWSYEFSLGANIFLFAPSVWYALTQLAHLLKSFIIFKAVAKTSRTYGLNLQMIKRWIRSISWLPTVNWI